MAERAPGQWPEATRVTWTVDKPSRLMVFARLSNSGARSVQTGSGDGAYIRVRGNDQGEQGCLHVIDDDVQMMMVNVPRAGDIILTVEAGPAGSASCDSVSLAIYASDFLAPAEQ